MVFLKDSTYTVLGESFSAGRLYDKIGESAVAKVVYKTDCGIVCKVSKKSLLDNKN